MERRGVIIIGSYISLLFIQERQARFIAAMVPQHDYMRDGTMGWERGRRVKNRVEEIGKRGEKASGSGFCVDYTISWGEGRAKK